MGLLGSGGFGSVTLRRDPHTGNTYALKTISKGYLVRRRMLKGVLREKEILFMCNSDFIVRCYRTYKDAEYLYFLTEDVERARKSFRS